MLRLIMDDKHRQYSQPWSDPIHVREWIIQDSCFTKEDIFKKVEGYKKQLEQGPLEDIYKTL